jgi:hypothetical protein
MESAQSMSAVPKRVLGNLIILGVMVGILWLDDWVFRRVFQIAHWRWYLENGVEIAFVATTVALVWKEVFESNTALISAEPAVYYAANFHLIGVCIETLGVQLQSEPGQPRRVPWHELLFGLPLVMALGISLALWLLVVAPAQYFLVLVGGAPARILATAPNQLVLWFENDRLRTGKIPRDQAVPEDRMAASFSQKPVAVTNLFVSLLLLGLRHVVGPA